MTLRDRIRALEDRIPAVDPGVAASVAVNNPEPAFPTEGPNRLTFFVPQYETVWSLGQESATWGVTRGIVGVTEPNVYFETTAAPKTAVSLGTSGKGSDFIGQGITGYMLRTDGNAFRHADKQLYFTTTGGDMIVHAEEKAAVLQSDAGRAEINAGDSVSLKATGDAAITAQALTPCQVAYDGAFSFQTVPSTSDGEKVHAMLELAQSCLDLSLAFKGPLFQGNALNVGEKATETDWAAVVLSSAKIVGSGIGVLQNAEVLGGLNTAKLNATNDVGLGASIGGVLGAPITACATGGFVGSMVGSCATVVGLGYAAVWGGLMSELSSKKVILSSRHGDTTVQSLQGTSITGKNVSLTGEKSAQMNSHCSKVAAYGRRIYVGAAGAHGMVAGDHDVAWGKVTSPESFASAAPAKEGVVKLDGTSVTATFASTSFFKIDLSNARLVYKDREVSLGFSGVTMVGKGVVELKPR